MKTSNIIIATVILILLSSLLTGCSMTKEADSSETSAVNNPLPKSTEELVEKADAVKKEVKLLLDNEKTDDELKIEIKLSNPEKKAITSVQSWLTYNPDDLKGKEINTDETDFSLTAPYNNDFDETNGFVMIGRSNPEPLEDETLTVATVTFDVLRDTTIAVDAYDYRDDLSGHTSVNILVDGVPYNVLIKPISPTLLIEK